MENLFAYPMYNTLGGMEYGRGEEQESKARLADSSGRWGSVSVEPGYHMDQWGPRPGLPVLAGHHSVTQLTGLL